MDQSPSAERTEVWREPVRGGYGDPRLMALSGRERLRAWRLSKGPAPPLYHLTGALPSTFGDGTAEAEMPSSEWLLNSAGLIGGGTLAIVADIAFGCSIQTRLGPGIPYTTAELSLSFLRPVSAGGTITAAGQAIHVGRSVALSEAFILAGDELVAHGTSRCAVLPRVDPLPELPTDLPDLERPDASDDPYRRPPPVDRILGQEVWDSLSGAEILSKQMVGELPPPPIFDLTGMAPTEAGDGTVTAVMPSTEWLASPARRLQGGTIVMLADTAMQLAVMTKVGPGAAIAGLDVKANFLRPVPPDGRDLTARAEVVHSGRTIAITRVQVSNADGKPVLLATGSSMLLQGRPAHLGPVELSAEGD
jgi:uncharacterized protein (TIGR00369 family)